MDETVRSEHLRALSLPKSVIRWALSTVNHIGVLHNLVGSHNNHCGCQPFDQAEMPARGSSCHPGP